MIPKAVPVVENTFTQEVTSSVQTAILDQILETVIGLDQKVNNSEDLIFVKEVGKRVITTIERFQSKGQIRSKFKLTEEEMKQFEKKF